MTAPRPERVPRAPGSQWRVLAHGPRKSYRYGTAGAGDPRLKGPPCIFDELVVDSWLHVEQMDTGEWWMSVGDARIWVSLRGPKQTPHVYIDRGEYGRGGDRRRGDAHSGVGSSPDPRADHRHPDAAHHRGAVPRSVPNQPRDAARSHEPVAGLLSAGRILVTPRREDGARGLGNDSVSPRGLVRATGTGGCVMLRTDRGGWAVLDHWPTHAAAQIRSCIRYAIARASKGRGRKS